MELGLPQAFKPCSVLPDTTAQVVSLKKAGSTTELVLARDCSPLPNSRSLVETKQKSSSVSRLALSEKSMELHHGFSWFGEQTETTWQRGMTTKLDHGLEPSASQLTLSSCFFPSSECFCSVTLRDSLMSWISTSEAESFFSSSIFSLLRASVFCANCARKKVFSRCNSCQKH